MPPLLLELLKSHEERLPALGAARAEQRQRETTRGTPAGSKTTVRGHNGKTPSANRTSSAAGSGGGPVTSEPVAPILGEQTSLFDLKTGRRHKADAGGAQDKPAAEPAAETPAAGGE